MKKLLVPIILLASNLSVQAMDPLRGPSKSAGTVAREMSKKAQETAKTIGDDISALDREIQAPFDRALASGRSFGQVVDDTLQPIQRGIDERIGKIDYQRENPKKIHQKLTQNIMEAKKAIETSTKKDNTKTQLKDIANYIDYEIKPSIDKLYQKYSLGKDYFSKKEALTKLALYNDYYKEIMGREKADYNDLIENLTKQINYLSAMQTKIQKSKVERKEHRLAVDILQAYAELLKTAAEKLS